MFWSANLGLDAARRSSQKLYSMRITAFKKPFFWLQMRLNLIKNAVLTLKFTKPFVIGFISNPSFGTQG